MATEDQAVTLRLQEAWDSFWPELPPIIFADAEAAHLAAALARPSPVSSGEIEQRAREAVDGWFVTDEADVRGRWQITFRGKHVEYVTSDGDDAWQRMSDLRFAAILAALADAPRPDVEAIEALRVMLTAFAPYADTVAKTEAVAMGRAALSLHQSAAGSEMVTVPREPTEAMLSAAAQVNITAQRYKITTFAEASEASCIWSAMIDASLHQSNGEG